MQRCAVKDRAAARAAIRSSRMGCRQAAFGCLGQAKVDVVGLEVGLHRLSWVSQVGLVRLRDGQS